MQMHEQFHSISIKMAAPLETACLKISSDEEVRRAVHEWLRGLPRDFFLKEFMHSFKLWRTCIERGGDYVEK